MTMIEAIEYIESRGHPGVGYCEDCANKCRMIDRDGRIFIAETWIDAVINFLVHAETSGRNKKTRRVLVVEHEISDTGLSMTAATPIKPEVAEKAAAYYPHLFRIEERTA